MALTIAASIKDSHGSPYAQRATRDYQILTGTMTWDSAYTAGGLSVSEIRNAFPNDLRVLQVDSTDGFSFEFDVTNDKVLAYTQYVAPRMVYEESVTSVSNTIDLAYRAAFIWYISNNTKAYIIVDKGTTPGAGECAVDFTPASGTTSLTFASADSDPTVLVTYWPAASNKQLADALVESDVVDASASSGHASLASEVMTLTDGAAAIICVDVDGTPLKPIIDDDTTGAGEYDIDWTATNTVITGTGTEFSTATSIKVTWITLPSGFTTVEDASAHSSDVITIADQMYYIPCHSSYIYNDDNDAPGSVRNSSETIAASDVTVAFTANDTVKITNHADLDVAASGYRYVKVHPNFINSQGVVEVQGAADLSSVVANFIAIGF